MVALTIAGGLLGLGAPAAASGAALSLTVNPAEVIAGRPSEFRFDTQHDTGTYLYAYSQPVNVPCAGKPSLHNLDQRVFNTYLQPGTGAYVRTYTYDTARTFRLCGYLQPSREDAGSSIESSRPVAAGTWDITVRGTRSSLAVAGIPAVVPPGGAYDVSFTTSTEASRQVTYLLVPGGACPANTNTSYTYSTGSTVVNGGPAVKTARVNLSGVATGVYTWCGYVGADAYNGQIDQAFGLGSFTIAVPPAPPAPIAKPQPPACALVDRSAKRGTAVRVRCYRVPGKTVRVRYKRKGKSVTKVVTLVNGVARAGTRGLAYGSWSLAFLTDSGKVGTGRITVKRG